MKENNNKLFGGVNEKANEKAHTSHSKDSHDKSKSVNAHKNAETAKHGHASHEHSAPKAEHKVNSHKKD